MDNQELKVSVMEMLLIFEISQPDIGYVIGMEKIAMFLKRICDDFESFLVFYNLVFSFKFMWSCYSQDHKEVNFDFGNLYRDFRISIVIF